MDLCLVLAYFLLILFYLYSYFVYQVHVCSWFSGVLYVMCVLLNLAIISLGKRGVNTLLEYYRSRFFYSMSQFIAMLIKILTEITYYIYMLHNIIIYVLTQFRKDVVLKQLYA